MTSKLVELNNGVMMPLVGFGTFRIHGEKLIFQVIEEALKAGYRAFDTAAVYGNEQDIGKALEILLPKYNLKRQDIFLTTKLAPSDQGTLQSTKGLYGSLKNLRTTYIDLYLIHWPGSGGIDITDKRNSQLRAESWHALAELVSKGKIRALGVSNYTIRHLQELLANCANVRPTVNQVELHPQYPQEDLVAFCNGEGILVQAYCSLGGTGEKALISNSIVKEAAASLHRTSAQILLRWALQQNIAIIPKSITPSRIAENFDLDFEIDEKWMNALNSLKKKNKKFAWNPDRVV